MAGVPVCRPWSSKGRKTLDYISRGPAKLVIVNDGEAEVPALLLSQDMFCLLNGAIQADHDADEEHKENNDKVIELGREIDEARAKMGVAKGKIRYIKKSIRHGKYDENVTSQLESLYKEKSEWSRQMKYLKDSIKKIESEGKELEEKVRLSWRGLGTVMEEAWKSSGFFDVVQSVDQLPCRKPRDVGEIERSALDLLKARYEAGRDSYQCYKYHMNHREQKFSDWLQSNGIKCVDQYETDKKKDAFLNLYVQKTAQLHRDVEEKESAYMDAYNICQQLGVGLDLVRWLDIDRSEEIINALDRAYLSEFEDKKDKVNAWVCNLPGKNEYDPTSDDSTAHARTDRVSWYGDWDVYPWDSGSYSVQFHDFEQRMDEYEAMRVKQRPKTRLDNHSQMQPNAAAPVDTARSELGAADSTSGSGPGEVKDASNHRHAVNDCRRPDRISSKVDPHETELMEGAHHHARETHDLNNISVSPSEKSMTHRKRKFGELTQDSPMVAPKRKKAELSLHSDSLPGNTVPMPLTDSYIVSRPECDRPVGTEAMCSVPKKANSKGPEASGKNGNQFTSPSPPFSGLSPLKSLPSSFKSVGTSDTGGLIQHRWMYKAPTNRRSVRGRR